MFTLLSLVNAKVAFSATVIASHGVFTGPANTRNLLIFDKVFTNIGNAYNSKTGMYYCTFRLCETERRLTDSNIFVKMDCMAYQVPNCNTQNLASLEKQSY